MNRLVLIGNGFDLAHDLKTKYEDFIYWYWKNRILNLYQERTAHDSCPHVRLSPCETL